MRPGDKVTDRQRKLPSPGKDGRPADREGIGPKSGAKRGHPVTLSPCHLVSPCPLCGASSPRPLLSKNGYAIARCGACGLGYVDPMPSRARLAELYNEAARRGLTHTVSFDRYIGVHRPGHLALARQVMAVVDRHAEAHQGGRLLDVGCAAGFLLDEARRRGWDVAGVELSRDLGEYAREQLGLDIFLGDLADAPWPPASFQIVTVIGTIEHVPDPRTLVGHCCRLLVPDGRLVILTENLENPIARHLATAWNGFMPPEHLFHFTPETLGRLLNEQGATVEAVLPLRSQLRAALGGLGDFGAWRLALGAWREGQTVGPAQLPAPQPSAKRQAPSAALKERIKWALDGDERGGALVRSAYRIADGIWQRVGVADRMIVVARRR